MAQSTDWIGRYLEWLRAERGSSELTVTSYGRDMRQLRDWLCGRRPGDPAADSHDGFDPLTLTTADIRAWLGTLGDRRMEATTLRRKAQSVRSFCHWLLREGAISKDPSRGVVLAKKKKPLPNFVREDEMEAIMHSLDERRNLAAGAPLTERYSAERDYIVMATLYSLGLREAELMGLTDADIDFNSAEMRVTGKRRKQRVVPLPPALLRDFKRWQQVRDERYPGLVSAQRPTPLIAGAHGALSIDTIYNPVRRCLATASTGRKSPHTLRHTFATAMINDGGDLDSVREMLGHSSLATTQVYTHVSISQMLENYKGAHPRTKKK